MILGYYIHKQKQNDFRILMHKQKFSFCISFARKSAFSTYSFGKARFSSFYVLIFRVSVSASL